MVSTTHPGNTTSAGAHRPRAHATLWRLRSLRRPVSLELRPEWSTQLVASAMIVIATAISIVLLALDGRTEVEGSGGVLGLMLHTVAGLVGLSLATLLVNSARSGMSTAALAVATAIGGYAALVLVAYLGVDVGIVLLPANTALLFVCLGFGLLLGHARSVKLRWFADGLVLAGAATTVFALIAKLFGSTVQYPIAHEDPMLAVTAVVGLLLAVGILLQRADRGLGKLFTSSASGGVLARRLIPTLLVLPIAIARLVYFGVEAGTYDAAFATAIGVMSGVTIITLILVFSARVVDRLDQVRRGNEAQIRQLVGDVARQSKELQNTNRELESFSYSVSHDLRAPIRHIAGFCELLTKHGAAQLDDKLKRYAANISEAAQNAGKLIDELLEFSRMGRIDVKARDIPLEQVVRDVWNKLATERAGRDIALRTSTLPAVKADPTMLEAVVTNLLSNAIKYTGRCASAVVEIGARCDGDDVEVSVRDNGVGFDMKYVDKLFGVFQRLHGDEFEGVGIGLANVKRIVERHGGRVRAEGELDRGATFYFTMPRAKDVTA